MLSDEVLSTPDPVPPSHGYTLHKRIAAIRLIRVDDRRGKLGEFVQLIPGSRLHRCGDGYNDQTVKVHSEGEFYFVFVQDLRDIEALVSRAAQA